MKGTLKNRQQANLSDNYPCCQKVRGVPMSNNAVTKGYEFELAVEKFLNNNGLKAWRTNKTNPFDPDNYKHGFDGGVDIIATFETSQPYERHFDFYIQCKNHKNGITKTAISEVYAGMHARHAVDSYSVAVVIATGEVSQETRLYAKNLGVELFLRTEMELVENASKGKKIYYAQYGVFLKALLYHCTKDSMWVQTMPENNNRLSEMSDTERLLLSTKGDLNTVQSYTESAYRHNAISHAEFQKAVSLHKILICRVLDATIKVEKQCRETNKGTKKEKPTIDADTG